MVARGVALALGGAVMLMSATPIQAKPKPEAPPPAQLQSLMACRVVADTHQRLACFDREASAMSAAVARKDLVIIDRDRARAAQRSLFGFSVANFGGLIGANGEEVKEIETVVASSNFNRDGGWTVRLKDGSVWTQIDSVVVPMKPEAGEKVVIRRAAFGSFFMKVGQQIGFRAKRIG